MMYEDLQILTWCIVVSVVSLGFLPGVA